MKFESDFTKILWFKKLASVVSQAKQLFSLWKWVNSNWKMNERRNVWHEFLALTWEKPTPENWHRSQWAGIFPCEGHRSKTNLPIENFQLFANLQTKSGSRKDEKTRLLRFQFGNGHNSLSRFCICSILHVIIQGTEQFLCSLLVKNRWPKLLASHWFDCRALVECRNLYKLLAHKNNPKL